MYGYLNEWQAPPGRMGFTRGTPWGKRVSRYTDSRLPSNAERTDLRFWRVVVLGGRRAGDARVALRQRG